jgi:S1-C subfamily serine protease
VAIAGDIDAYASSASSRQPGRGSDRRPVRSIGVTGVDWIIVGLVLLLALFGWAQGFVSGILAFAGLALGAWLGTRVGPLVLPEGSHSPWAPAFGLLGALVVGALLAGLFEAFGGPVRRALRSMPGFGTADGVLGAILIAAVGLGVVWILGALAVQSGTYELRRGVQRSAILQRLNTVLPPSGPILNSLRRLDPVPQIDGPEARVDPPAPGIARDPEVQEAAASVVKVLGSACGLGVAGSGWVAADGLVVTNAHVVAGERDTRVLLGGREPGLPAQAVHFDSRNDVAILRVGGLAADPLPLAREPRAGTSAAILGFPLNGPFDVRAARLGETLRVTSSDAYGRGPVERSMTGLRGLVRSGNSGGPVVDGDGRVVATVFAATTRGPRGGYGVPNQVVRRALAGASGPVSTGPCAG